MVRAAVPPCKRVKSAASLNSKLRLQLLGTLLDVEQRPMPTLLSLVGGNQVTEMNTTPTKMDMEYRIVSRQKVLLSILPFQGVTFISLSLGINIQ